METLEWWLVGGRVVAFADLANEDFGERWAVYNEVQVLMTEMICWEVRSARVRLCVGEKVIT